MVLLGDSGTGKSSIVLRFVTNSFDKYSESTIGASFMSKLIEVDGQPIKYQIWDTVRAGDGGRADNPRRVAGAYKGGLTACAPCILRPQPPPPPPPPPPPAPRPPCAGGPGEVPLAGAHVLPRRGSRHYCIRHHARVVVQHAQGGSQAARRVVGRRAAARARCVRCQCTALGLP